VKKAKTKLRNTSGQSLVEYALGLGCVCCVCMAALSSLGFICGTIILQLQNSITYQNTTPTPPGLIVKLDATPWIFN